MQPSHKRAADLDVMCFKENLNIEEVCFYLY